MSRPQEPQRPSLPFGNLFRMKHPKGSYMSPKLLALVNKFEQSLAGRLAKLIPKDNESIFSLPWMALAMALLSETHNDVKSLISDLDLPLANWDEKWIDVYLGNSVKLLDICIAFSSEISRLSQGQLLLQGLLHNLDSDSPKNFAKARISLDYWWQHIGSRNPRVENCCSAMDQLMQSLALPKIKDSAKGKALMQAIYGVRIQTILLCSVLMAAFRGSTEKLIDLDVPRTRQWTEAYINLQSFVNEEISDLSRSKIIIKELVAVDEGTKALFSLFQEADEAVESEAMKDSISELKRRIEIFSGGLDVLANKVDGLFQVVLGGRDGLLCNLRTDSLIEEYHKKELQMR